MNQNCDDEELNSSQSEGTNETNLPLEEKIVSKRPQIRKEAYEEILSSGQIEKYESDIEIFLSEPSQIPLLPAFKIVLNFIQKKQVNPEQAQIWSRIIIEQSIRNNDAQCLDLSKEIMCELLSSNYESVLSTIKTVFTKNIKAIKKVMQCEIMLEFLIEEFGTNIRFSDIDEDIKGLTTASNPGVRNYAMTIIKSIYKWDKGNTIANELLKDKEKEAIDNNRKDIQSKRKLVDQKKPDIIKEMKRNPQKDDSHEIATKSKENSEENHRLFRYYTSNEFLDKLVAKHQKALEKKRLLEELTSFFINEYEPFESELAFSQYTQIFDTLNILLNENNSNVIIAEIGLLSYFSKLFLHNEQYCHFLLDITPKLLDKFNLQSNAINNEIHKLLNDFIEYNLTFEDFFAYLENISIDDNINYTINLLTIAFEQIKKDNKWTIKNMTSELLDLFQKLSVEDNNEISNLAFNILEILNMRNYITKPQEEIKKDEYLTDRSNRGDCIESTEEKSKHKGSKSFRSAKGKKDSGKKNNFVEMEEKKFLIETAIEETTVRHSSCNNSQKKAVSSKHIYYDDIVIGPGKKPNPANEMFESKPFEEEIKSEPNIQISHSKQSNKSVTNYDDRVVGGKSNFNQMFSDEIKKLNKDTQISKKATGTTVEELSNLQDAKKPKIQKKMAENLLMDNLIKQDPQLLSNKKKKVSETKSEVPEVENQLQVDAYAKESKEKSLTDFQKKLDLALKQEEVKPTARKNSNDLTDSKKIVKDETQFEEIKSILGKDIVTNLDGSKWETKKQGLEEISKLIQSKAIASSKSDDLFSYLKFKLKNFKETNFNINREAITLFATMFSSKNLSFSSKQYLSVLDAYYDKFSDTKLKEQINQLITSLIDIQGSITILKTLLEKLQKKPNVNLLKEYSALFAKCVEDYEINQIPIKEMVELCKTMASNSNPQVRTASTSLLCVLYKYIGNDIKVLIKDIKESTLKIIEAELDKITVVSPSTKKKKDDSKSKAKTSKDNQGNDCEQKGGITDILNELIPRIDISKKITAKLLKDINTGKWPEKKEACEAIEKIITDANMKILPNGLGDLFNLIKSKLSDSNKNIVRMIISLLNKLIEACGSGFKGFTKPIALSLLPNFADKMQVLREECHACLDKWVTFAGFDTFVYFIPPFIKTDNVEIRSELIKLLMKNKELFNKSMGETVFKDMISPLLLCLQDKAVSVRTSAEEMIVFSFQYITLNSYFKGLKDFKPSIANDLKSILEKLKTEGKGNQDNVTMSVIQTTISNDDQDNEIKENSKGNNNAQDFNSITEHERLLTVEDKKRISIRSDKRRKHQLSNEDLGVFAKKTVNNTPTNIEKLETPSSSTFNTTLIKSPINTKISAISSSSKKSAMPKFQIFISNITIKPNKEKRLENDKKFKFSLETLVSESDFKLRDQVKGLFTEEFIKKIFNEDFKQVVEAINGLKILTEKDDNITNLLDNLDLILKIIGFKVNSNQNPSMLKALFDFLELLFSKISTTFQFNDTEINIIISLLVDKLGVSNNTFKELLRSLIDNYFNLFTATKSMKIALNCALGKHIKIKSEILEICTDMYIKGDLDIINRQYARLLSRFLSLNDNNTKFKAVALFKEIYSKIGEELWSIIDINEKERKLLESNIYEYQGDGDEEEYEENEERSNDNNNTRETQNQPNALNGINKQTNENIPNNLLLKNFNTNYQTNFAKEPSPRSNSINGASKSTSNTSITMVGKANLKDKNDLLKTLKNLVSNDVTERVNTIIIIHEFICAKYEDNKDLLISNIDIIIQTFRESMHTLFSNQKLIEIPIKFTKYLATVLCKIASNKELITSISYDVLFNLTEEILSNLLVENLDKIGDNQEGSIIFKSLNSTMLRILENCNSTYVIIILLDLIKNYRIKESKLAGLAIKCLLKVNQNIQQIIDLIEIDKILLQFHLILCDFEKTQSDLQIQTQTDQMILRYIKNFLNEIVKIKKEEILNDYIIGVKPHPTPDKYILKWIRNVLSSLNIYPQYPSNIASNQISTNTSTITSKTTFDVVNTNENVSFSTISNPTTNTNQISANEDDSLSKRGTNKGELIEDLKNRMIKQQTTAKPNHNQNVLSHDFNNTISELKKKWNDVNKKSKGKK